MALRLRGKRAPKSSTAASLRKWGIVFLAAGVFGQCILQNRMLGVGSISNEALLGAMEQSDAVMGIVTLALLLQVIETCAAPLFCFLLVEGFLRTSSFEKYLLRVGGLALICELPYNLAYTGNLIAWESRNPVLGMAICLVMLYFIARFEDKSLKNIAMKVLIFVAAFLWCLMLRIDQGVCLVIITMILWAVPGKSNFRAVCCFGAAMVCTMFNMNYLGACLASIFLHRYNEERGEQNKVFNYAWYPVFLLFIGLSGMLLK